jgi:hypothetical protein
MLSQSYNISASWSEYWAWYPPGGSGGINGLPYPGDWNAGYQVSGETVSGGYNLSTSDGSPVAASTAAPSPVALWWNGQGSPLTASAGISPFSVQNYATAFYNDAPGFPAALGGNVYFKGRIQTSVQADWLFSPIGTLLNVNINALDFDDYGPEWAGLTVTLSDMTDSTTLLNIVNPGQFYQGSSTWQNPGDNTFAVNPSDIYEFSISGWTDTFDGDYSSGQDVTASITSVPEPGACLLLSLGLAGLLGFKRRFRS